MQKLQTCKKIHNQRKNNRGFSVSEKYKLGTLPTDNSSVPEGKLMGVELIGVYKSGSINWG